MIDHTGYQLAMRAKLLTLEVVTTGSTTLSATATGYARASGSFITDGFAVGMEVVGSGFANGVNNTPGRTLTAVTALALTCSGCTAEGASAGRTVSVGVPDTRVWENVPVTPVTGSPYFTEQYLPGPYAREELGPTAQFEARPVYVIGVHAVSNAGLAAASEYADALLTLFAPGLALTASNGDILRVRSDTGPFRGQLVNNEPGWAFIPVTVPFRVRTTNAI